MRPGKEINLALLQWPNKITDLDFYRVVRDMAKGSGVAESMTWRSNKSASSSNEPSTMDMSNDHLLQMKRKFQKVNQEIVKQNVALHEQLARHRREQHLILQENVRLKGRLVALEGKLREADGFLQEIRRSIGDRIDVLEAIGQHLLEVNQFLRVLAVDECSVNAHEPNLMPEKVTKTSSNMSRPSGKCQDALEAIKEEINESFNSEDQNVSTITNHVSDVSL